MSLCDASAQAAQETFRAAAVECVATSLTGHATEKKTTTNNLVWHYTHSRSFFDILTVGMIRPTTACVPAGELPITWFSTEQFWEPSVIKGKYLPDGTIKELDRAGMLAENVRLFRIGVDPATAPYRWSELKDPSGMHPATAAGLVSVVKHLGGSPSRWRGTFDVVPWPKWVAVETFVNSSAMLATVYWNRLEGSREPLSVKPIGPAPHAPNSHILAPWRGKSACHSHGNSRRKPEEN